jgi:hypothetical protein
MTSFVNLSAILAVSLNTLREAVRNKVFGTLAAFSVVLSASSLVLGEMSLHQEIRLTQSMTLFAASLFSVIITVYSSVTLLHTELERRTIYTLLTKPVRRWEFLVGKTIGVQLLMTGVLMLLGMLTAGLLAYQGSAFSSQLAAAYFTIWLQLCIVNALAHALSCIASPLLAGFSTLGVFVAGRLHDELGSIKRLLEDQDNPASVLVDVIRPLLPNLASLNLEREAIYALAVPTSYLVSATVYALSYALIVLLFGIAAFSRKDLN